MAEKRPNKSNLDQEFNRLKEDKNTKDEHGKDQDQKQTIDPYTGEEVPVLEDAEDMIEIVPVDTGEREGEDFLLEEEEAIDNLAADEHADGISRLTKSYTEDETIEQDFEERQKLARGGRSALEDRLEQHHSKSPDLAADDLDARWEYADQSGEETVGGTTPTPDMDTVDEIGEALGIEYDDDEPLQGEEKLKERDRSRLEPPEGEEG